MPDKLIQDRIEKLLEGKRGTELIAAIAAEFDSLNQKIEGLRADLARFEAYSRFVELQPPDGAGPNALALAVDHVSLSAVEHLSAKQNFYNIEHTSTGYAYRWTGPGRRVSFAFLLDRSKPLRLEITIVNFVDQSRQTPVVVKADGVKLNVRLSRSGAAQYLLTAMIPPRDKALALQSEIECVVPETLSPSTSDSRLLGLAFGELRIVPQGEVPEVDEAVAPAPEAKGSEPDNNI